MGGPIRLERPVAQVDGSNRGRDARGTKEVLIRAGLEDGFPVPEELVEGLERAAARGLEGAARDEHERAVAPGGENHGRDARATLEDGPWLDVAARGLGEGGAGVKLWNGRSWAFALTFDIDSPGLRHPREALRYVRLAAQTRGPLAAARLAAEAAVAEAGGRDAFADLHGIGKRLERLGIRATWFVQALKAHKLDNYDLGKCPHLVKELKELHARGHEVGVHSSYVTCERGVEFLREQRRIVEELVGAPTTSHRHHYLRTRGVEDHGLWEGAGFRADSSLGWAEREGFRLGTCWPLGLVGEGGTGALSVIEVPLVAMDVTLRHHRGYTPEAALARLHEVAEQVRRVGGVFVFLWHPHNLDWVLWREWGEEVFWRFLEEVGEGPEAPWFGTVGEVAERYGEELKV